MKTITTILFLLTFTIAAFGQTQTPEEQQEDFKNACVAGALKVEGCPKLQTQTAPGQKLVKPPDDHSLDHALDKPVETFTLPKVTPAAALPMPAQPAPETEPEPQFKSTPAHPVVIPGAKPQGQRQQSADCGPATAPPGAGALYGINRAMCLRRAARQRR